MNTLEYCLNTHPLTTNMPSDFSDVPRLSRCENAPNSLSRTRSFESIFNAECIKDIEKYTKQIEESQQFEKRKNILLLKNYEKGNCEKVRRCSNCSSPCFKDEEQNASLSRKFYSPGGTQGSINSQLWKTSRLDGDSCESTEEDCEKVTDIPCNDSGYSTKLCSNSQGPSPSLSGTIFF